MFYDLVLNYSTASGRLLGTCKRSDPQSPLICYATGCEFEGESWRTLENHIKKDHNNKKAVFADLIPFSDAILAQSAQNLYAGDTESDEEANSATRSPVPTQPVHVRSTSLDSGLGRTRRTRSTDRVRPYFRISPGVSRSPSPVGRGRSTVPRESSPVGRGISPSRSFTTTPVLPSPLNRVLFSRPVSPTEQSDIPTTTSESIGQFMDLDAEEVATCMTAQSSDEEEPPPPPPHDQTSSPTGLSNDEEDKEDVEAWNNPDTFLQSYSLSLVRLTKSGRFPTPQFLTCTVCHVGVPPKSAVEHVKKHLRKLPNSTRRLLENWLDLQQLASNSSQLVIPLKKEAPLPALQVHSGYICRKCGYAGLSADSTMRIHSSTVHNVSSGWMETIRPAYLQTFFPSHPVYFEVASDVEIPDRYEVVDAYLKQMRPMYEASKDVLPMASTDIEVPPLLRITHWHHHLANYINSQSKTTSLLTLMQLPTSRRGEQHLGEPLRKTIQEYMEDIKGKANTAPLAVRCLLMECPR